MDYTIEFINVTNIKDINVPNEPFEIYGRIVPSYIDSKWSFIEAPIVFLPWLKVQELLKLLDRLQVC